MIYENEKEFINAFNSQKEYLKAWGNYIKEKIELRIENSNMVKIPIEPRIKDNTSIINKAFYRDKNYKDPLNDITDKVGLRIVVLLLEEIEYIKNIIESEDSWIFSKDRDFDDEKDKNPKLFEYQSVHYILRTKEKIEFENISIPKNTPCEVQVRTLLQHSYSELTHDTIYKSNKKRNPDVYRLIARSMALIETTDIIFKEVDSTVKQQDDFIKELLPLLEKEYKNIKEPVYDKYISNMLQENYQSIIEKIEPNELNDFFTSDDYEYVKDSINNRYNEYLLFKQPIIIIIYYIVCNYEYKAKKLWPFTENMLEPIYIDMGITFSKD
ncbi:GTP pyrophosphokinase [Clostridium baratii]|uniref:GTP pyrophosphokinase n=1 Tax=Clostridium baratii TaxID=1561 RepID=UPI00097FB471|nr:hypothetical protein [Clostridium baratii]AQM60530.1 hypothetical protein NPD11_402 [Clostridium baratii]